MKVFKSVCFVLLLFLSACEIPQYVMVPVDYSPKLYLRRDSSRIVIINQFQLDSAKINNARKYDVLKAGAFAAVKFAQSELTTLKKVKVINLVDSIGLKINTDSVKFIAKQYRANYVLVLKHFNANVVLGGTDGYSSYYNTAVSVDFVMYESNGLFYKKLNGQADDPQTDMPYMGLLGSLIIHPTVRGSRVAIKTSAEHAAQNALQDYFPYYITHNRPLFNDAVFQPAVREILAGNLAAADSLLQPFLKDKNVKIAAKAAYNLSVVYESENDIESATDMAQQSNKQWWNDYAQAILADLKEE